MKVLRNQLNPMQQTTAMHPQVYRHYLHFLIIIYHYDSIIVFVVRNNFLGMAYIHTVGAETPLVIDRLKVYKLVLMTTHLL